MKSILRAPSNWTRDAGQLVRRKSGTSEHPARAPLRVAIPLLRSAKKDQMRHKLWAKAMGGKLR